MGYTVELEESDLRCRSREAAERAAATIDADEWIHPYHLQVSPVCGSSPPDNANWFLEIDHFQGDHWHDEHAQRAWLAIAPFMADGATLEFRGEGFERWRIRWETRRVFEEYITETVWAVGQEITATQEEEAS